ncbi:MAG: hypothetical protein ABJE47_20240 [bacterium]
MTPRTKVTPTSRGDGAPQIVIELTEWDNVSPSDDSRLRGCSLAGDVQSRRLAEALRGRVDVREGHDGLEVGTTSFVGRVDVGPLRIAIAPKLPAMPLARLLRYAYGLRDVAAFEDTLSPTTRHGLHDLLIALLASEVEELLHRGLSRRYVARSEQLASPRGQILVDQVIRQGGVREARLPCRYVERRADWHLNQVLRAGLEGAALMTQDHDLRRRVHQLASMFGDVGRLASLCGGDIDRAEHELTRMTVASRPALTIIRLLHSAQGVEFDSTHPESRMPGFLFDMNTFFQRLLSRFLRDNLTGLHIMDELAIRNVFAYSRDENPKRRRPPAPRPDYALFDGKELCGFLDAKYRDIWDKGLPAAWLYQLSIYALASPRDVSALLYATMSTEASDERIEIRPVSWSSRSPASVIVRPISLLYLASLLDPDQARNLAVERRRWANELVALETSNREPASHGQMPLARR